MLIFFSVFSHFFFISNSFYCHMIKFTYLFFTMVHLLLIVSSVFLISDLFLSLEVDLGHFCIFHVSPFRLAFTFSITHTVLMSLSTNSIHHVIFGSVSINYFLLYASNFPASLHVNLFSKRYFCIIPNILKLCSRVSLSCLGIICSF